MFTITWSTIGKYIWQYWGKLYDEYQANNMRPKLPWKLLHKKLISFRMEQVISPEMPRFVSPVILVIDIDPFFADWFRPSMDTSAD